MKEDISLPKSPIHKAAKQFNRDTEMWDKFHKNYKEPKKKDSFVQRLVKRVTEDEVDSENKNAADDELTGPVAKRFEKDKGFDKGDWGRADKTYAPGPTYEGKMKTGKTINESETQDPSHKTTAYHKALTNHGYRYSHTDQSEHGKSHRYTNGAGHTASTGHHESGRHSYHLRNKGEDKNWMEGSGKKSLTKWLAKRPDVKEQINPLLLGVIKEAAAFTPLATTTCQICGGNHPEAVHTKAPGTKIAEGEAEEFQGRNDELVGMSETDNPNAPSGRPGRKYSHSNPINQKGSVWKQIKKKLQMEDEEAADIQKANKAAKCAECGEVHAPDRPCAGKELLDELGEEFFNLAEVKQSKPFDKTAHIKAISRNTVGQVPGKKIMTPKPFKKEKHKPNFMESAQLNEFEKLDAKHWKRLKVITSHKGYWQFLSQCDEDPIGYITRTNLPSPYSSGPNHTVWNWEGHKIISVETSHKRYEVYEVPDDVQMSKDDV
jgi:hypothetical protein